LISALVIAAIAAGVSWSGVAIFKRWAHRHQILDVPNARSSHRVPVPRGGGIAIVITVSAGIVVVSGNLSHTILFAWLAGSLLIAAVSWVDDLRSLPTVTRFLAQSAGAIIIISAAGPLPGIGPPAVSYVLTFMWIVGLTNAFNFMDGIDGIAGGQAAVAGVAAGLVGFLRGELSVEVIGALVAGASIGFLIHNWSPAATFMGDVGSAFLGYSLAVVPLLSKGSLSELLLMMICALWPFLFDSTFTFFRRLAKGENVIRAHRSHLYQRLVQTGASHASVALIYVAIAAIGSAAGAIAIHDTRFATLPLIVLPITAATLVIVMTIRERRVTDSHHPDYHES